MLFKLAWRNIWRNKTRSFITITAIFVSVFLANMMQSVQQGMWSRTLLTTISLSGYIQIQAKDYQDEPILDNGFEMDAELETKILELENVYKVVPRIQQHGLSAYKDLSRGVMMICMNPELEEEFIRFNSKLDTGRVIKKNDNGILVGKGLASYYDMKVGDSLAFIGAGYFGASANGLYPITGLVKYGTNDINSRLVIMPHKLAQKHFEAENIVTTYNLYLNNPDKLEATVDELKVILGNSYRVKSWKELMPELEQAFQADTMGNLIFLGILYLIISFGIFGTILMMTAERMYEFGVMISIGMRRFKIITTIYIETVMLTFLGVLFGCLIAYPFMYMLEDSPIPMTGEMAAAMAEYGFEAVIAGSTSPSIFIFNTNAILIVTMIIVVYPTIVISKLNPLKAMRK